ncbi:hypothetical protein [Nocardia cerradoensis]|uniref:hypothetical protein n=2 Tax=Nocardia cerradoensis TaxID=85688 RepID=UPI0014441685|nr:hypothetical protein [Nocardia cerradoensis]NKY43587.1 hypothetical protein [Nocardia cerradoensis]
MTDPQAPRVQRRPVWQQRLLDRIQDLSDDRGRLLREGYDTPPGAGELSMLAWRTQLLQLAADRSEIEARAHAIGIPPAEVAAARAAGSRGRRADLNPEPGADAVREHVMGWVASDVWQIQHMAAIDVAHRRRAVTDAPRFEPEPGMVAQFERNLSALWIRAGNVADAIGLTVDESAGMWARTSSDWQRILDATTHSYDDEALEERWRVYASPGIETSVIRDATAITLRVDVALSEQPVRIPTPHAMKTAAAAAFLSRPATGADPIADAIERALPAEADHTRWDTPTPPGPPQHPGPDLDHGAQL